MNRQRSRAFMVAGAVMVAGLLLDGLTDISDFGLWPWLVASGIAISTGIFALGRRIEREAPRLARIGRVLAVVAGLGAVTYVVMTISFRLADVLEVALPGPLAALFILGALAFLIGTIAGALLIGIGALNNNTGLRPVGGILLLLAVLFLTPFPVLFGTDVPEWTPFVSIGLLAAASLALGFVLRSSESGSSPSTR